MHSSGQPYDPAFLCTPFTCTLQVVSHAHEAVTRLFVEHLELLHDTAKQPANDFRRRVYCQVMFCIQYWPEANLIEVNDLLRDPPSHHVVLNIGFGTVHKYTIAPNNCFVWDNEEVTVVNRALSVRQ
jgi:hypothetical protein